MQKRLEHTVKGEGIESSEQIRYLNLFLSTRAKQKSPKIKTQNVLSLIISELSRLKIKNLAKAIAAIT